MGGEESREFCLLPLFLPVDSLTHLCCVTELVGEVGLTYPCLQLTKRNFLPQTLEAAFRIHRAITESGDLFLYVCLILRRPLLPRCGLTARWGKRVLIIPFFAFHICWLDRGLCCVPCAERWQRWLVLYTNYFAWWVIVLHDFSLILDF